MFRIRFQLKVEHSKKHLQATNRDKTMKLPARQSNRSIPFAITTLFGILLSLISVPCWAQQDTLEAPPQKETIQEVPAKEETTQQKTISPPFDVFAEPIDSVRTYIYLEKLAVLQKESQAEDAVDVINQQLRDAEISSDISLKSLSHQGIITSRDDLYPHMVKACLFLGQFYDCGRCDRSHLTMSCGVVIDESGLALTNYHVIKARDQGTTEGFMAMTYDGKTFEVEEVLAADEIADVALVRLKGNGYKFHAAPIAKTRPTPSTEVRLVSHPSGEFFVMTKGEVSRYSHTPTKKSSKGTKPTWLEITADFGGGSSGCGVFNNAGEVVGIASRIKPITRAAKKVVRNGKTVNQPKYSEMTLRRCVDLNAIHHCFAQPNSGIETSSDEVEKPALDTK